MLISYGTRYEHHIPYLQQYYQHDIPGIIFYHIMLSSPDRPSNLI